jgi:putative thiamine transport system ATP-binding protein
LRQDIRQHVFQTLRDAALPTILVTHDVEDAAASGGPVITLG